MLARRTMIGAVSGAALAAMLGGCATTQPISLEEAVRRLLSLASQRALAGLMAPNGFYDSQIARITLPAELDDNGKAGSILKRILLSRPVKDRLFVQVNRAAEVGAQRAAPILADTIRTMSVSDAMAVLHGGGHAATTLLQQRMGDALVRAMLPGIGEGLRLFDSSVVTEVLSIATGINFARLADDVTRKASDAIYLAMGREEEAIRANPRATNDALLIAALALSGGR